MFNIDDTVRVTQETHGMPPGSEGYVVGWYEATGEVVVRFWDGGPIRVPVETLELVRRAEKDRLQW